MLIIPAVILYTADFAASVQRSFPCLHQRYPALCALQCK